MFYPTFKSINYFVLMKCELKLEHLEYKDEAPSCRFVKRNELQDQRSTILFNLHYLPQSFQFQRSPVLAQEWCYEAHWGSLDATCPRWWWAETLDNRCTSSLVCLPEQMHDNRIEAHRWALKCEARGVDQWGWEQYSHKCCTHASEHDSLPREVPAHRGH